MSGVINAVMRGVKSEVRNVKNFVMTPVGPFETVDAIVRDARRMTREVAGAVGVAPGMLGQRLRRKLPRLLRR